MIATNNELIWTKKKKCAWLQKVCNYAEEDRLNNCIVFIRAMLLWRPIKTVLTQLKMNFYSHYSIIASINVRACCTTLQTSFYNKSLFLLIYLYRVLLLLFPKQLKRESRLNKSNLKVFKNLLNGFKNSG